MTTSRPAPILELDGVAKAYGGSTVLAPTDLQVEDGEFLTVLGPSGSGKTTILRLVGGFARPDAGRLLLDGSDITAWPSFRRPFNTVFQDYALFPHMSVESNVAYGLRARRTPEAEVRRRVEEVLAVVGLQNRAANRPAALSGGQRQRVALARAIVCEPRIVLLDEPLAALDAELRRTMRGFLKDLQRRIRTTFVFVTHDQEEAMAISDRIVVMDHGRIEQVGAPKALYEQPANAFVARFFGENNLLNAIVEPGGAGVTSALGRHPLSPGATWPREVLVALRPERVRLSRPGEAAGAAERSLEGEVRDVVFLGASCEVAISVGASETVRARIPNGGDTTWLAPGMRVQISWPDDAVRILRP